MRTHAGSLRQTKLISRAALFGAAAIGAGAFTASTVHALDWDAGPNGGGSSWATTENWNPDGTPAANADYLFRTITGGEALGSSMSNGRANSTVNSITFDSVATTVSGSGTTLTINTNGSGATARNMSLNSFVTTQTNLININWNAGNGVQTVTLSSSGTSFDIRNAATNVTLGSNLVLANTATAVSRLVKEGAGTLVLGGTAANYAFTGGMQINGGTLQTTSNTAINTGGVTLANAIGINSGGTWRWGTSNDGDIAADRGISIGSGGGKISVSSSGAVLTLRGVITGDGRLTKNGAGTLELTGSNTITGGFTVEQGTLRFVTTGAMGPSNNAVTNIGAGTVRFSDSATLASTRTFNLTDDTAAINVDSGVRVTIQSPITGARTLNKGGSGTLVLAADSPFLRGLNVNSGTVLVTNTNTTAVGQGAPTIVGPSPTFTTTPTLGGSGRLIYGAIVSQYGVLAPSAGGSATLNAQIGQLEIGDTTEMQSDSTLVVKIGVSGNDKVVASQVMFGDGSNPTDFNLVLGGDGTFRTLTADERLTVFATGDALFLEMVNATITAPVFTNVDVSNAVLGVDENGVYVTGLTGTVPEPTSLGLIALAGAGLLGRRRRK